MEKNVFDIFNIKTKIQNKPVSFDATSSDTFHASSIIINEQVENQKISTDSNINIIKVVDLGNWDSGPVCPKLKVGK